MKTARTVFRIIIGSCIICLLFSCNKNTLKLTAQQETILYPAPPDTARIQFLLHISDSKDVTGNRKTFKTFVLGEEENIPINKPYGIAVCNGKMFICDTHIHGLVVIDMNRNTFGQFIPTGKGELKMPVNCFIDKSGKLYIADSERKQIVVFDAQGNFLTAIGEAEEFKPVDVSVQHDKIWVTNIAGHQVNVYSNDSAKELLNSFPPVDKSVEGCLFSPTNIFVNDSAVYVTDFGDFKIKKYTLDGEYISSVGSYGQGLGQFVRPKGIAVDKQSNLYVVDAGFENVQIFNQKGDLLLFFGGNYKGPGDMWLPAKVTIDYENTRFFEKYVDPEYQLKYLIFVSNQFGPDKLNVYGAVEPRKGKISPAKHAKRSTSGRNGPMF